MLTLMLLRHRDCGAPLVFTFLVSKRIWHGQFWPNGFCDMVVYRPLGV